MRCDQRNEARGADIRQSADERRKRLREAVEDPKVAVIVSDDREKPPGFVVRVEVFGIVQYFEAQTGAEAQVIVDRMKVSGVDRQTIRIYVISEWRAPE